MTDSKTLEECAETPDSSESSGVLYGFSERLRLAIGSNSLRGFSRECKLSEATLRSYLSGETYPTLDRLEQIAEAAGMSPITLAFGSNQDEGANDDIPSQELLGWACLFIMANDAAGARSAAEVGQQCWRIAKGLAENGEGHELARVIIDVGRAQLARLQPAPGED
ncbi:helix-turn-helix domain-containing protein [Pseudomonas sp. ABC1]|uniref:helix-turn-helix domain-containing protein n=1 Tax=Pseudomonas sp. ABC1 TaxID=2748080 RepID=UPI002119ED0F|nr:helix-turn-helix transcriptional regulator [Pseudomonas sp. ABC1]